MSVGAAVLARSSTLVENVRGAMIVSRELIKVATDGGRVPLASRDGEARSGAPPEAGVDVAVVAEPLPGSGSSVGTLKASRVLEKSQVPWNARDTQAF